MATFQGRLGVLFFFRSPVACRSLPTVGLSSSLIQRRSSVVGTTRNIPPMSGALGFGEIQATESRESGTDNASVQGS